MDSCQFGELYHKKTKLLYYGIDLKGVARTYKARNGVCVPRSTCKQKSSWVLFLSSFTAFFANEISEEPGSNEHSSDLVSFFGANNFVAVICTRWTFFGLLLFGRDLERERERERERVLE